MTDTFNQSLIDFIREPDNFLASLVLVNAFHTEKVMASEDPYAILVDEQKVIPVFTDLDDFANFKETQESSQAHTWIERPALEIIAEARMNDCNGIVFNLKQNGDAVNTTIFPLDELVLFINQFTTIMNNVMSPQNQSASVEEKVYFVPSFVHPDDEGKEDRLFPSMSNEEGSSYIPVFSNVQSLASWYTNEQFGGHFRQASGQILIWTLSNFKEPANGENELDQTDGVVIDPFISANILKWDQL